MPKKAYLLEYTYYRPPKSYWNASELIVRILLQPFGIVNKRGEYDNKQNEEKEEQVELLHGCLECVHKNFEATGVTRQLEQAEYPYDRDELIQVRVLEALVTFRQLHHKVKVEGERGHKVNDVHRTLDEVELFGRHQKANNDLHGEPNVAHNLNVQISRMGLGRDFLERPSFVRLV